MRKGFAFSYGLVVGFFVILVAYGSVSAPADAADTGIAFSILHSFTDPMNDGTGIHPVGDLTPFGSTLYGMTPTSIFEINTRGTGFKTLHTFSGGSKDGRNAVGSLILSGSTLYGMTGNGGTPNAGTIFKIGADGTGFQLLYSFAGGTDGANPSGSLTLVGSTLYGMTVGGGAANSYGTIFKIGIDGKGHQVIWRFGGYGVDGMLPCGALTALVPTYPKATIYLYGMTTEGGNGGGSDGIIFRINTDGGEFKLLHNFGSISGDGIQPTGSLTLAGSTLYGMTPNDVIRGKGVIFKINADDTDGTGYHYQTLYQFTGGDKDGQQPNGSLTLMGPNLFGMTFRGGPHNPASDGDGVIFQIKADGSGFKLLHTFASGIDDGGQPMGSLVAVGNALYGMTENGGAGQPSFEGVVFSMTGALPNGTPSVDTPTSSNITSTGASLGANIGSNGVATITASGIAYGTSANPAVSGTHLNTKPVCKSGPFLVDMTGLAPNTTYHYRGYATNSAGTNYTDDATFTTQPAVNAPTSSNITSTWATLGATIGSSGGATITASGIAYGTSASPTVSGSHVGTSPVAAGGVFKVNVTGLTPNTLYHYRGYVTNSSGSNYTADATFTTLPAVNNPTATNISSTGATLGATIGSSGGAKITASGIAYGKSANPTASGTHVNTKPTASTSGAFTLDVTGLTPNTVYHYRGYVTNSAGTSYTSDATFTTLFAVSAPTSSNITSTGASLVATIGSNGGPAITASGIAYGMSANPTVSGTHMSTSPVTTGGAFKVTVTGLLPNTVYHYRGYATNSAGTSYTADAKFTTLKGAPGVVNSTSSNITTTGATLGATIGSDGGYTVTDSGVAYDPSANPTVSGTHVSTSPLATTGTFSLNLTGLTPNTVYHYRGYATNSQGTSYTADQTFTTLPAVNTPTSSNITSTGVSLGAAIVSTGGATITDSGVAYDTSANPTVSGNHVSTTPPATTGTFSVNVAGLTPNTVCHYRGYATNSQGTSYTADQTFTTLPAVDTPTSSNITSSGASLGATIGSGGGAAITDAGIAFGTSANPTVSGNHVSTSPLATSGTFSVDVTGLTANTVYHYRGYATNSQGTSYTADQTFTTLPAVDTPTLSSVSPTGAILGANISSNGGAAITDSGIAYDISPDPTVSGTHVSAIPLATSGAFTVIVSGLSPGTIYHYRGYATNSAGTSYTIDTTFITSIPATVDTPTSSNITSTGATLGANISSYGGTPYWDFGIAYGTNPNPTISGTHASANPFIEGVFTVNVTQLLANTVYYFRGYLTNSEGTSYTADATFMTPAAPPLVGTPASYDVTSNGASLGTYMHSTGGLPITDCGVAYGASANPTVSGSHVNTNAVSTGSTFGVDVTGLMPYTVYHYRGYATNSLGTTYTHDATFTTLDQSAQLQQRLMLPKNTAQFSYAFIGSMGVTVDGQGNIYVAGGRGSVQKLDSDGNYLGHLGSTGSGNGQFIGAISAAVDSTGNIYVLDNTNNRVEKFDSSGNCLTQWGSLGYGEGQFLSPCSIAVDSGGNVYVLDTSNKCVEKFDSNGNYLTQWGSSGFGIGQFDGPNGLAVDAQGNVYVVDINNRVQKFDSVGNYLTQWGSMGSDNGQFNMPFGITVDSHGNIYVADKGNNRVQKFDPDGNYLTQLVSNANGDSMQPFSLAVDGQGNVYVADESFYGGIRKFDSNGNYLSRWGTAGTGNGQFNFPYSSAVDNQGNIFVADFDNNRIQKFDAAGNYLTQWGSLGSGNGQLDGPTGVSVDGQGNVYVVDTYNNRVQKFDSVGNYLSQWGSQGSGNGQLAGPAGIALDAQGNVYVTDLNNRVQKFDPSGNYLIQWGSWGTANGQFSFNGPCGVAVDGQGNVYVADIGNHRVQKFDSSGNYITQWGSKGSGNGQFNNAGAVVVDSHGNVYVADTNNNRLERFDSNGNFISSYLPAGGQFYSPVGVGIDNQGNIYVADRDSDRILSFYPPSSE